MFKILVCSIFIVPLCTSLSKYEEKVLDDTELLMTFMVFRHGDRAPVELNVQYVTDKEKVLNLIQKVGYGQLTDSGKRRGYKVGEFIRRRYDGFLSSQYNQSEIYIRSTDSTRTKMTVLAAMAAVYPVEDSWCDDIEGCGENNWTPVPYTTESAIHDFNLAVINCPTYISMTNEAFNGPAPAMAKYSEILDQWSTIIGVNITRQPSTSYLIYDVYTSQISMGVPLSPELEKMLPKIEEVAGVGIHEMFGNDDYLHLSAGVLLKKFFEAANKTISGTNAHKLHVYSGHDFNVYTFMAITRARPLPGVPKYGSVYALELRKDLATGQHIVVPVYLHTPSKYEVTYPQVEECEGFCELSKFHELVSKYQLDLNEWRTQCEWSEDYDFDLRGIE